MFYVEELNNENTYLFSSALIERYNWLNEHNLHMWKIENLNIEGIILRYERPVFYGAFEDKICIGGFILIEEDKRYWPNNITDKAFYFHKFVVRPKFSGKGYADKILEWVKEFGGKKGKAYIRLDYEKRRDYLRKMYLKHGFQDYSEMKTSEGNTLVLAQYVIG
jgi:GNAT superfamily N-acetyltransferase